MNDQAVALRVLSQAGRSACGGEAHEATDSGGQRPEIWAFASGKAGIGLRTVAASVAAAIQQLGRPVKLWDASDSDYAAVLDRMSRQAVLVAILGGRRAHLDSWQAARYTFLVTDSQPENVLAAYVRLKQLGAPHGSRQAALIVNKLTTTDDARALHGRFDRSTRQFLQLPSTLAAALPRLTAMQAADSRQRQFPSRSLASAAIRALVAARLQVPLEKPSTAAAEAFGPSASRSPTDVRVGRQAAMHLSR